MKSDREAIRSHLTALIRLNPYQDSHTILSLRRAYLTGEEQESSEQPTTAAAPEKNPAARREAVQGALNAMRREFWNLDEATVLRRIEDLPLEDFPDLQRTAWRLSRVAAAEDRIAEFEAHPRAYPQFLRYYKAMVIATPRESIRLRKEADRDLLRPVQLFWAQKAARVLRTRFTDLHDLAADWLHAIRYLKKERNLTRSFVTHGWWIGCAVYLAFRVILHLVRTMT